MKNALATLFAIIILSDFCSAQSVSDPLKASFVTGDITNFWKAFDMLDTEPKTNPFENIYLKQGSAGVQAFMKGRIEMQLLCLTLFGNGKMNMKKLG